jgi:hypothetical protein
MISNCNTSLVAAYFHIKVQFVKLKPDVTFVKKKTRCHILFAMCVIQKA